MCLRVTNSQFTERCEQDKIPEKRAEVVYTILKSGKQGQGIRLNGQHERKGKARKTASS